MLYFYCQLDLKIKEKLTQNRRKSSFKLRCALEHNFLWILVDFGANLGSQIEPESRQNQVEKQVDFMKKRGRSMPISEYSSLVPDPRPPGDKQLRARSSSKTKSHVRDLTRLGPKARELIIDH